VLESAQVYNRDIRNLLSMEDMWRFRDQPVPLDYEAIREDRFELCGQRASKAAIAAKATPANGDEANGSVAKGNSVNGAAESSKLRDQCALSLRDSWEMFVSRYAQSLFLGASSSKLTRSSTEKLAVRLQAGEETISFDKDDDDTLSFVTAAANLRSAAYGIDGKTRWEVKGAFTASLRRTFD
jgi:ubiquitin-like 1-activating enzyme E1 B